MYNFYSFTFLKYVLGPECGLSWCMPHVSSRKLCIVLLLDGVFYKCELDQFGDCTIWVKRILIDFMPGWSVNYIYQVSKYNSELVYLAFKFCQFLSHISTLFFGIYTLIIAIYFIELIPLILCNILFVHDNFCCSEIIFSKVNIATSTFFGLVLAQLIYFYPFSFNLSCLMFSFNLKLDAYR